MICYIMCILLWIAYLWLDCMVVAYAFEPRRDSVRQAGIILGLMAAQLPDFIFSGLHASSFCLTIMCLFVMAP